MQPNQLPQQKVALYSALESTVSLLLDAFDQQHQALVVEVLETLQLHRVM